MPVTHFYECGTSSNGVEQAEGGRLNDRKWRKVVGKEDHPEEELGSYNRCFHFYICCCFKMGRRRTVSSRKGVIYILSS